MMRPSVNPTFFDYYVQIGDPVHDHVNVYAALGSDLDPVYVFAWSPRLFVLIAHLCKESGHVLRDLIDILCLTLLIAERDPEVVFLEVRLDQMSDRLPSLILILFCYLFRCSFTSGTPFLSFCSIVPGKLILILR